MSIKHILAPLTGEYGSEHVALAALRLGQRFAAHVTADWVDFGQDLYTDAACLIPGINGTLYDAISDMRVDLGIRARRFFDDAVAVTEVPIVSQPLCAQASTEWLDGDGGEEVLSTFGPLVDLIILNAPAKSDNGTDWRLIKDALFGVRRPVLVLPEGCTEVRFDRPVIAWNGSVEAAAAVRCGLELFEPQANITVIQAGHPRKGFCRAENLIGHLGWHCFAAKTRHLAEISHDTGMLILTEAEKLGASVLVMGAYTHSRTREMLLGGVTDFILKNADLPVLLAH